jgi:hypothetical protein
LEEYLNLENKKKIKKLRTVGIISLVFYTLDFKHWDKIKLKQVFCFKGLEIAASIPKARLQRTIINNNNNSELKEFKVRR